MPNLWQKRTKDEKTFYIFIVISAIILAAGQSKRIVQENKLLKMLEDKNLIAFKYCDQKGVINESSNPNGSMENIKKNH